MLLRKNGKAAIVAHRGFSAKAPENTLAAIGLAISAGAHGVEIDVGFSADRALVVIHDESLDRTTSGRGPVRAQPLAALRRLDAGAWFSPAFAGERIPLLEEVLALVRGKIPINVEIKGESVEQEPREGREDGIEACVLRTVADRGRLDQVLFSSFHPLALWRLRRLSRAARTASLFHAPYHRGRSPAEIVGEVGAAGLHLADSEASAETIAACRAAGIPLRIYTVNDAARYLELSALGVDAVFTDDPGTLLMASNLRP